MQRKYSVTSSPHLRDNASTQRVMLDVCLALAPAGLAGIWFFGLRAGVVMLLSVLSAVVSEYLYEKIAKRPVTIGDGSAVVTGLLLAYNLPATAPWWLPVVGAALAIVLVKQFFGGIGQNFMNPALAARAILTISWASLMTAWVMPQGGNWLAGFAPDAVDVVAKATPLAATGDVTYTLGQMFLGNIPGTIGETSKLALLIGAAYLFCRKVITWRIPGTFLVTAFVLFWVYGAVQTGAGFASGASYALYQLLGGGLILGAFFMATDYAPAPVTPVGQIIFGVGCGLLLFILRTFNSSMAESCSFAILLMNVASPLIERFTRPRVFGEVKQHA